MKLKDLYAGAVVKVSEFGLVGHDLKEVRVREWKGRVLGRDERGLVEIVPLGHKEGKAVGFESRGDRHDVCWVHDGDERAEFEYAEPPSRWSRKELIAWLEANDPNGDYSDEATAEQGLKPLTISDARTIMLDQLIGY